jgi:signal transduction histidine kinase
LALLQLATAALILAVVEVAILRAGSLSPQWIAWLFPLGAAVYFAFGWLAWLRRPTNQFGALLSAGGLTWLTVGLANADLDTLIAVGQVLATVPLAIVVHMLLAFPSGRLVTLSAKRIVLAGYFTAIVLQAPLYLFAGVPAPYNVLQLADLPELQHDGNWVQRIAGLAVMAATALVLARRLRRATSSQRRVLGPLFAYGIAAVLAVPLTGAVLAPLFGWSGVTTFLVQWTIVTLVPVAFGLSMLSGGFARTAEVEELGAWLGADERDRPSLRDALARTLGDPSLALAFWVPDRGGYVDADGRPTALPVGSGRSAVEIERRGLRVGAFTYDSTLVAESELARAAGRVVGMAVDRERLTAELRANEDSLFQSRRRIVEAGDRERRRIERNLHDGAQQRMMSVALTLRVAEDRADASCPEVRRLLVEASSNLDAAVRELRELARGVHPALLMDVGLGGALESLAERSHIPVRLTVDVPGRLPEAILVGAYYVAAEALANAAKHSGAGQVVVDVRMADRILRVTVNDNGLGGAHAHPGSGLEGLVDRVESLGGSLRLSSAIGAGTSLVAELPCA